MDQLIIEGNGPLNGEVAAFGAKNAALPILCAGLLVDDALVLRNVPELWDVGTTQRLLRLMYDQTVPNRMRAGLPPDVRFADKCGTSYTLDGQTAAFNDIGIITWPDGHTVVVAAFLTGSRADAKTRNALFADIARAVAREASK